MEEIIKMLREKIFDVGVINAKKEKIKDISEYELVIVGIGMSMGKWTSDADDFLIERRKKFDLAMNQQLLDEILCLNVSSMNQRHKEVTFTETSNYFCLHSELEKMKKANLKEIVSNLKEKKEV